MSRWFRFYSDAVRNPKIAKLSDQQFRLWIELLSLACENDGKIPDLESLKHILKRRLDHLSRGLKELISAGLMEPLEAGYQPKNWKERQFISDTSTHRVRKLRQKRNVSVTAPDTDTEAETDKEEDKPLLSRGGNLDGELGLDEPQQSGRPKNPSRYAFEGHVIRLTHKDFDEWHRIFHAIPDLRAELYSLDIWLKDKPDKHKGWFSAVSGMLSRKQHEAVANPRPVAGYAGSGRTLTPQEQAAARQRLIDRGLLQPETVQ